MRMLRLLYTGGRSPTTIEHMVSYSLAQHAGCQVEANISSGMLP